MRCSRCGSQIQTGVPFCPNCGTTIQRPPINNNYNRDNNIQRRSTSSKSTSNALMIAIIIGAGAILFVIAVVAAYLLVFSGNEKNEENNAQTAYVTQSPEEIQKEELRKQQQELEEQQKELEKQQNQQQQEELRRQQEEIKQQQQELRRQQEELENQRNQAPIVVIEGGSSSSGSSGAYGAEPVAYPSYSRYYSDDYDFGIDYPSHFQVYNDGGTVTLYTCKTSDGSARELITAMPAGQNTVSSSLNSYISSHPGSITYKTSGSDYYAVNIRNGGTEYYKYCKFKNGNMYWFEFISPAAYHDVYDRYINSIYNSIYIG